MLRWDICSVYWVKLNPVGLENPPKLAFKIPLPQPSEHVPWTIPPLKRISCDGLDCVGHPATLSEAGDGLVICAAAAPSQVAPFPVEPFLAPGAMNLASARFRRSPAETSCSLGCLSGSEPTMNLVDSEIVGSKTSKIEKKNRGKYGFYYT